MEQHRLEPDRLSRRERAGEVLHLRQGILHRDVRLTGETGRAPGGRTAGKVRQVRRSLRRPSGRDGAGSGTVEGRRIHHRHRDNRRGGPGRTAEIPHLPRGFQAALLGSKRDVGRFARGREGRNARPGAEYNDQLLVEVPGDLGQIVGQVRLLPGIGRLRLQGPVTGLADLPRCRPGPHEETDPASRATPVQRGGRLSLVVHHRRRRSEDWLFGRSFVAPLHRVAVRERNSRLRHTG